MTQVLCQLPETKSDKLIVGLETSDDAAVYKLNEETAIIQTLDFFTPVVDDPYIFGQIAATNSLSDVYAMGGDPIMAMNIVCFPSCLPPDVLAKILQGGFSKVKEAGAITVGGHSVEDDEPKYGLSVTGLVRPEDVLTNSNAKVGDYLILTKPLGLGIINTAIKGEVADSEITNKAIEVMTTLNKYAKEAIDKSNGVNSVTDITGFGLIGHAIEMAEGSCVSIKINSKDVPVIKGTRELAEMGLIPAGAYGNRLYFKDKVEVKENVEDILLDIMFDPQTSGGLLISVSPENLESLIIALSETNLDFNIVGNVLEKEEKSIIVS